MTESAGDGFVEYLMDHALPEDGPRRIGKRPELAMPYGRPKERRGDWMQTSTGGQFWPLDPRADEVDIVDIAYGLSKICRYGGHCIHFYSVAEHSVLVAQAAPPEHRKWALLHDASEAYLGDVIRPLKRFIPGYADIEATVMRVIAQRYGLSYPMPSEIKAIDNNIILDEMAQIMAPPPVPWNTQAHRGLGNEPLGVEIQCWRPERAAEKFLELFVELGGELS